MLDFTTVWVQRAGGLVVERRSADGVGLGALDEKLELVPGEEAMVSVSATSTSDEPLLGAPFATWSSDSEAVTIVDDGVQGRARLVARASGSAEISVLAFGLATSFAVEVGQVTRTARLDAFLPGVLRDRGMLVATTRR